MTKKHAKLILFQKKKKKEKTVLHMFRICQTVISLEKGCKGYLFRRPNWIKNCEIIFAMGAYFGGRIFLRTLFMRVYTKIPYVFISSCFKRLRIGIFQHKSLNKVSIGAINIFMKIVLSSCHHFVSIALCIPCQISPSCELI